MCRDALRERPARVALHPDRHSRQRHLISDLP
jgi:hypothetical protein